MGVPYAEVIGDPIAHSKSPAIHKFWLGKLGIEGDYRATHVAAGGLSEYLAQRRDDPEWRGCNVAMPHKRAVLACMARLAPPADLAGSINVIIPEPDGSRAGFNTDVPAVAILLGRFPRVGYPNHVATYVQVIGAGGAARAAVVGAAAAGYGDFDFFNRTLDGARELAAWLSLPPDAYANPLEGLGPIRNHDDGPQDQRYSHVVINASSLGMTGNPPVPIDLGLYYADTIVFDMVYSPIETPLLAQARSHGLRVIDGLEMLVEQAACAFPLFFGQAPPREHDAELREVLVR